MARSRRWSADGLDDIRDADAFAARRDAVAKQLFGEAMERLRQAEAILAAVAEARAKLESPLMGWASGNLDDMRAQLAALTPPGFLRDVPAAGAARIPALPQGAGLARRTRAARPGARPGADAGAQAVRRCAGRGARARQAEAPGWQALRWELEELRVSLFAQELGARGGVSPKKLAARLAQLRSEAVAALTRAVDSDGVRLHRWRRREAIDFATANHARITRGPIRHLIRCTLARVL